MLGKEGRTDMLENNKFRMNLHITEVYPAKSTAWSLAGACILRIHLFFFPRSLRSPFWPFTFCRPQKQIPHMTNDSDSTNAMAGTDPSLPPVAELKPSYDTSALKAYFIALDRHARGEPANTLKDWLEAERQVKSHMKE